VTDTAGHGRAWREPDCSYVAGAGAPGAGHRPSGRSTPTPGRPLRTDPGSAVRRRRAGSTRARAWSVAAPAEPGQSEPEDLESSRAPWLPAMSTTVTPAPLGEVTAIVVASCQRRRLSGPSIAGTISAGRRRWPPRNRSDSIPTTWIASSREWANNCEVRWDNSVGCSTAPIRERAGPGLFDEFGRHPRPTADFDTTGNTDGVWVIYPVSG
jgi:hypothetical protein